MVYTVTNFNYNPRKELSDSEWNIEYHKNLNYWGKLKSGELQVNDALINELMENKNHFYIKLENDDPYKAPESVSISLYFQYIGSVRFYGLITKELYYQLIELKVA